MIISAKSKTFLVGEYCVACGGGAILLCTKPDFKLRVKRSKNAQIRGIDPRTPAFAFYLKNKHIFNNLFIKFIDPYKGMGGFGASSAQFSMLYRLRNRLVGINGVNYSEFLDEYRLIAGKELAVKPSGADCLAQIQNNHIYFDGNSKIENLKWDFNNIDFLIFRTGYKTPTHEHLRKLSVDFISKYCERLAWVVEGVKESWTQNNSVQFGKKIMDFFYLLNELGVVREETKELVSKIIKIDGVLAAKGCGAMASDTIVVIFAKALRDKVVNAIKNILKENWRKNANKKII